MAKKLVIFMASVGVAAAVTGAYASRKRRGSNGRPLLETAAGTAKKYRNEWRPEDDSLTNEFASVVADEVAPAR